MLPTSSDKAAHDTALISLAAVSMTSGSVVHTKPPLVMVVILVQEVIKSYVSVQLAAICASMSETLQLTHSVELGDGDGEGLGAGDDGAGLGEEGEGLIDGDGDGDGEGLPAGDGDGEGLAAGDGDMDGEGLLEGWGEGGGDGLACGCGEEL